MSTKKKPARKRKPGRGCIVGNCPKAPKSGAKVCADHLHPLRLQEEIERLRSTRDGGWEELLGQYPDLRRVGENLAVLAFRAFPMKGASMAVVARSRGHGVDDGIVALGDHVVRPGYAAGTKRDEGRLGAAVAKIRSLATDLDRIVDPEEAPGLDPRIRCGARECDGKNVRQPADTRFCRFCGRQLSERDPVKSAAAKQPRVKPSVVGESHATAGESAQTGKRAGESTSEPFEAAVRPVSDGAGANGGEPAREGPGGEGSGVNGHSTRRLMVAAKTMNSAGVKGLADAREVWPDAESVVGIEAAGVGHWRVTVSVR